MPIDLQITDEQSSVKKIQRKVLLCILEAKTLIEVY